MVSRPRPWLNELNGFPDFDLARSQHCPENRDHHSETWTGALRTTQLGVSRTDFIAIELVDGRLRYVFDVGSGVRIIRDRHRRPINDNRWHEVHAHWHIAELFLGPFCVTRFNPTHQLTDPTQPNPTH